MAKRTRLITSRVTEPVGSWLDELGVKYDLNQAQVIRACIATAATAPRLLEEKLKAIQEAG